MMKSRFLSLGVIALAIQLPAHAADLVQATSRLSKLSYQLKELDSTDGVKASVVFEPTDYEGTELSTLEQSLITGPLEGANEFVQGSVFSSQGKVLNSQGMKAAKTGTTLSTQAGFSNTDADALLSGPYAQDVGNGRTLVGYSRNAQADVVGALASLSGLAFTLAPHSSITFTGEVNATTAIDLSYLLKSEAFAKAKSINASIGVYASSVGEIAIQHPFDNQPVPGDGPQFDAVGTGVSLTIDPLGQLSWEGTTGAVSHAVSVSFANTSNEAVQKVFYFNSMSDVAINVISVPEPSTWMSMGLGLVALFGVARRRRNA